MSRPAQDRGHQLARELAALRVDDRLTPEDEAWLADHLEFCDACAAVASDYEAQHELFAEARAWASEAPRDLWARTSAAIEAQAPRGARLGRKARHPQRPLPLRLSLAPILAAAVVVAIVGASLLDGTFTGPSGTAAGPTPIALADTADVQVITRDSHGNLQLLSRPLDQVCPVGVPSCGAEPTFAVTAVSGVMSATTLQGAVSPSGDRMVVVAGDADGEGVYIIPVRPPTTAPSIPASATATLPGPASSTSAAAISPASVSPPVSASPAGGSATPEETATASAGAASSPPAGSSTPDTGSPTPSLASMPSAAPTDVVSAPPETAIKIASNVSVVGVPVYSADGLRLAFSAMPSDGSLGPDVYVWTAGDTTAYPVTIDHDSWLAGWTGGSVLVSRVVEGVPRTVLLDLATGLATDVGHPGMWLPAISPDGSRAVWWEGTLRLAADRITRVPDTGALVEGEWEGALGTPTQTLASGPLAGWQARWAEDGSALAVWIDPTGDPFGGRLSLYRVEPSPATGETPSGTLASDGLSPVASPSPSPSATTAPTATLASQDVAPGPGSPSPSAAVDLVHGSPDFANPMLNAEPANPEFSLRAGRLVWTRPAAGQREAVEVLAWVGRAIGRLEIPADGNGTVLP